mmetsp:Transcript_8794/g.32533  ORF Transcript_8794/g.32533 Transcript_8794/m.32533 type:complete len:82 (+) Transcript_8794:31-276(+)
MRVCFARFLFGSCTTPSLSLCSSTHSQFQIRSFFSRFIFQNPYDSHHPFFLNSPHWKDFLFPISLKYISLIESFHITSRQA